VLDLQPLAIGLGQVLSSSLLDHRGDAPPNSRSSSSAVVGVLDGVVQQRRGQHLDVGDAALAASTSAARSGG
jgi:hypothetical protein